MLRKLGKSITIVNAIAFVVVILVGGVSIYLTKEILHNASRVEGLSRDIIKVNNIHSDSYRLIISIHHFLIEQDIDYSLEAIRTIDNIKLKVDMYIEEELHEIVKGKNLELELLDVIVADIKGLEDLTLLMQEYSNTGNFNRDELIAMEYYAYELEDTIKEINKIHLLKIQTWIDEAQQNMRKILFIYTVFIIMGGVAIYAGHRALQRRVAQPIKALAAATIEFAEGKLSTRVSSDSKSEIGQLYQSFNQMAEKIQSNDEVLRKFNEELEINVTERTAELQRANEQLRKTQDALIRSEKIAAVGQIAAGVTHEIKNPLSSLSINAQMLIRDLSDKLEEDSSVHESANLMRFEINRINNILEEFVKFAKFPEPQFFDNDINLVIREIVKLVEGNAREAGVNINVSLQEDIPAFKFDARQFKEVLINLSENAIKSIKGKGSFDIQSSLKGADVIVRIADTGEGIMDKNLEKIFSPFFSTREGGMGLGLSIAQRIVESHGGIISCTSFVGEGTSFKITIPLERG